ncbi:MAG: phytanoyl-CoA dioxygenase family protein [Gammaproteobacteria bacterium]|jgi:ectoine hydroxylase-related dioxygenase (phytanoyl-CoA dioxygenase family)
MLSERQIEFFESEGYLLLERAVGGEQLRVLRRQFAAWVDESRGQRQAYGKTLDGRARFDLEAGHSADRPALRRVNAPTDISSDYYRAMRDGGIADAVASLIGPNVRFHHSKINSKLPGTATAVKWHQDFPFTPHSNDDLVTALLMLDDVVDENGPLKVVPGSHKGEIFELWHGGVFTGAVADEVACDCEQRAVTCTGEAGTLCLMHTRLLHGSAPNLSDLPRTLFIAVYSAEDAMPITPNPVPCRHQGEVVRGRRSGRIRSSRYEISLPQLPESASFFDQQAQAR